ALPAPQGAQAVPPQSTSVSLPFLMRSPHIVIRHLSCWQKVLLQSPLTLHALPSAQPPQLGPPQSVSDSLWFLRPSLHVAAWQVPVPSQTPPFGQSLWSRHSTQLPWSLQRRALPMVPQSLPAFSL